MKRSGFIRRRTRLKNASTKRRAINRKAAIIRREFCESIDYCDLCQRPGLCLVAHEIARAVRVKQFTEPACQLALCNGCHDVVHAETKLWSKVRQLALLLLRRPLQYDLAKYNQLAIAKVHQEDVDEFDGDPFAIEEFKIRKRA